MTAPPHVHRLLPLLATLAASALAAQTTPAARPVVPDSARAAQLYVSNRPADHDRGRNHARDLALRERTEATYRERSEGYYRFTKVSYRSRIGDLDIPAYLFEPLTAGAPRSRPALVWVHGGVHGNWGAGYLPFVREAVARGYVVIAPEYRGSTGYGAEFYNAIDYGGYEVDDVVTAWNWLAANLPQVDPSRVGLMGWSHGGYITLLGIQQAAHPFRAGVAIVPVTNLIFRLSYKGPSYQHQFATQARIQGLPFERRALYVERSPVYHVDRIQVPVLVHLATNDEDVNFVEAEMLVHALKVKQPDLAETAIYTDPPGGHSFSRRVDPGTLERDDTPEQRDSWNRVWAFLERHLRPYQ